jgi:hypothetical protein
VDHGLVHALFVVGIVCLVIALVVAAYAVLFLRTPAEAAGDDSQQRSTAARGKGRPPAGGTGEPAGKSFTGTIPPDLSDDALGTMMDGSQPKPARPPSPDP